MYLKHSIYLTDFLWKKNTKDKSYLNNVNNIIKNESNIFYCVCKK